MPKENIERKFLAALREAVKRNNMYEPVLLLGNGINRLGTNTISWEKLVKALMAECKNESIQQGNKPLTFLFEEITHKMDKGATRSNIKKLKQAVRKLVEQLEPQEMHKKFIRLKVKHILTTNYDYCLEKAIDDSFDKAKFIYQKTAGSSKKYSLRRYNVVHEKAVWHIHGEINNCISSDTDTRYAEHSIMLGFDQYMTYAEEILNAIKAVDNNFFSEEDLTQKTWLSFLFTSNIHIIGLDLGVFETHLWWLLHFRAQLMTRHKDHPIRNKIRYYIPAWELETKKDQTDMLGSLRVEIKAVPGSYKNEPSYKNFYDQAYEMLAEEIGATSSE